MAAICTWVVGGIVLTENATVVVSGNNVVIPAGRYYLYDAIDALNLIKTLETGIAAHVAGSTVRVLKNRKLLIDFNGNSTALTIPTALQEALGFTGSPYAGATSRTSEQVPGLLWSSSWPYTPTGCPVGVPGYEVTDRQFKSSPSGLTTNVTTHYETKLLTASWFAVPQERAWTPQQRTGEFYDFNRRVILPGHNMKLYDGIAEDNASSEPVTWTTALGPLVVPEPEPLWYRRFVPNSDAAGANITLDMQLTGEYPT